MRLKSVAGIVAYVKDVAKTTEFYEKLGFIITKREDDQVSVRLNWFWVDFHAQDKEDNPEFQKDAKSENKGSGIYLYISVEDVDEFYEGVAAKGIKPSGEPQDRPWGNREFVVRDPDGYKLVFFKKK